MVKNSFKKSGNLKISGKISKNNIFFKKSEFLEEEKKN